MGKHFEIKFRGRQHEKHAAQSGLDLPNERLPWVRGKPRNNFIYLSFMIKADLWPVVRVSNTRPLTDIRTVELLNLFKPTGYVMHQQFNIQQLYVLPTLYLCVLYLSENKQRLVPLTA